MKALILAAALLALPVAAHAGYGLEAQKRALSCTGDTIRQAYGLDFRNWVLPDFVPGNHLRAGQYVDENCRVQGAPSGPAF